MPGRQDLIFPHHVPKSPIAKRLSGMSVRYWMHNGFVNVDKEKMSKSLGNFVTVRNVLERNDAEGFRWFLLGAHYRGPIQFDSEKLDDGRVVFPGVDEAERRVDHVYAAAARLRELAALQAPMPAKLPSELTLYQAAGEKAEAAAARARRRFDYDRRDGADRERVGGQRAGDLCSSAGKIRRFRPRRSGSRADDAPSHGAQPRLFRPGEAYARHASAPPFARGLTSARSGQGRRTRGGSQRFRARRRYARIAALAVALRRHERLGWTSSQ